MWVLAYEDRCADCRGIAAAVVEATGGVLEIISLHDPKVVDAVGKSGRKADRPTLIGPLDGDVYQGASLGFRVTRLIGFRRAVRVLRLIGEDRRRSLGGVGLTRRGLLAAGGKVALGALVVGGALSSSAAANAATVNGSGSDFRRLWGAELAGATSDAVANISVAHLAKALQQSGYADYEQVSSTAVSASDAQGRTVTWLPLWHAASVTLAIIVFRSWAPSQPRVMLLQQTDGRLHRAVNAPAAQDAVVQAALDWSCLAECVAQICPACAVVCAFTGPFWPTCILNCCGIGVLSCYLILC